MYRRSISALVVVLAAAPAHARTIRGLVYDDTNADGTPTAGEPGVALAVVARGVQQFVTTGANGEFTLEVPDGEAGIVWVRVPDGFVPGPAWAPITPRDSIDIALHRLPAPHRGPLTFVVAADTHMTIAQPFWNELGRMASASVALDPAPAFFTILGDITSGNLDEQFDLVDAQLAGLGVPYIPVPGNHDWYDDGATWFRRYGPDNYSFDIARVHFVVWNMAMPVADIERYLGAELARVPADMTIVALTHAPPVPPIIAALQRLGVDYVLTAHTHTNRAVDHGGLVELTTEPMLMGGLDFTPAGYRVVTIDAGRLASYHRTTVDPYVAIVEPAADRCVGPGGAIVVAAELDGGPATVTARVDCATPIALAYAGGWNWRAELPALAAGTHAITVDARSAGGARATATTTVAVCTAPPRIPAPAAWLQLGGSPGHTGAWPRVIEPPLAARWTATVGGNILQAAPAIANGLVFVSITDLGDGTTGGVIAIDLATGAVRWRVATAAPVRGGPAIAGATVAIGLLDGTLLGLDAQTGTQRWRYELGAGVSAEAASVFAPPAVDAGDILLGNQRHLAVLDAATGVTRWTADPVPTGTYSQSLAAVAIGDGIVAGVFHRELGGVVAWDRLTGRERWRFIGDHATAINAAPVIAGGVVYLVNGSTEVIALDAATGETLWLTKLDPDGFDWGMASVGAPAIAHGIVVVPTLYRDLVALDAATGSELWRLSATPGPLRTTHYRGAREAGFEASPVITGDVVWAADTAGQLSAVELRSGRVIWQTALGTPVLAGLAVAGDWLVVASYDGSVRALGPADPARVDRVATCEPPRSGGCCDAGSPSPLAAIVVLALRRRRRIRA
ncbi:MAG: PQQ-binding-like beta-propeller repeat protein [Kofleriaceae bacterium]